MPAIYSAPSSTCSGSSEKYITIQAYVHAVFTKLELVCPGKAIHDVPHIFETATTSDCHLTP